MKHIIIRGPLGVGKSTIAQKLSKTLDYRYVSVDKIIEENGLVPRNADGVPPESFLEANKVLLQYSELAKEPLVIDGCFYYKEQIDDLIKKLDGKISIFTLTCSVEKCIERDSERGLIYGEDAARYVHMMTDKVKAGLDIDTTRLSADETLARIMAELKIQI